MADEINHKGNKPETDSANNENGSNKIPVSENRDAESLHTEKANTSSPGHNDNKIEAFELNIDQFNSDGTEQTNITNVLLPKEHASDGVSISIDSRNTLAEEKIEFHQFQYRQYKEQITPLASSYINSHEQALLNKFLKCRIAVINNRHTSAELAMAAIESIIFNKEIVKNNRSFSCTIDKGIALDHIVTQFKKKTKKKNTGSNSPEPSILVIYAGKNCIDYATELLHSISSRGGIADAKTNSLETAGIFIIFVCNDIGLYRRAIQEKAHFCLLNISDLHLYLYERIPDLPDFRRIIELAEIALSEYDWLASLSLKEQTDEILSLVNKGTLETYLKDLITSIDQSEKKILQELIRDPLQSLVLFTAAFFEGISIAEFDKLIRVLINGHIRVTTNEATTARINDLHILWDTTGDDILTSCGIARHPVNPGLITYRFRSQSRKNSTLNIFRDSYSLVLLKRFETIETTFLLNSSFLSDPFLKGITELAFLNALTDCQRYLTQVCLNITDQFESADQTPRGIKDLFRRLLFIIRQWEDNNQYQPHIRQFYSRMLETSFRREIMSILITYTCEPSHHDNLDYLKTLLDSTGEREYSIKLRTTRLIALNYLDHLPRLFTAIDHWREKNGKDTLPNSFAFAKYSILLVFYENRFAWKKNNDLDHQIIKVLIADASGTQFRQLASFAFSNKSNKAFIAVFGNDIKEQLDNVRLLEKAQTESMSILFAFILTSWHYILTIARNERDTSRIDPDEMIKGALAIIKEEKISLAALHSAFQRVIKKYNLLIIQENQSTDQNRERKEVYKLKRDTARLLARFSHEMQ